MKLESPSSGPSELAITVLKMGQVEQFADRISEAPVGVVLLSILEGLIEPHDVYPTALRSADPRRVSAAADLVGKLNLASVQRLVLYASYGLASPWRSDLATVYADAARAAIARRPLAEVVSERFFNDLHAPVQSSTQEWWQGEWAGDASSAQRDDDVAETGVRFWTVSETDPRVHGELIGAFEFDHAVVTRWRIPVLEPVTAYEVHAPTDWAQLVRSFPVEAPMAEGAVQLSRLENHHMLPPQFGFSSSFRSFLAPDWAQVAKQYDCVHLSWAGVITAEGYVTEASPGADAMLRGWLSERCLWLRDVFGNPQPLPGPSLDLPKGTLSINVATEEERAIRDRQNLSQALCRQ